MSSFTDERNRILTLVESGQITAAQAAQLLDALVVEHERSDVYVRNRTLRIWLSDLTTNRQKVKVTATIPVALVSGALRLWARLIPQLSNNTLDNLVRTIEIGTTGRLLDLQDLEEGKRVEIFVE
jgi:hypothetical protein